MYTVLEINRTKMLRRLQAYLHRKCNRLTDFPSSVPMSGKNCSIRTQDHSPGSGILTPLWYQTMFGLGLAPVARHVSWLRRRKGQFVLQYFFSIYKCVVYIVCCSRHGLTTMKPKIFEWYCINCVSLSVSFCLL